MKRGGESSFGAMKGNSSHRVHTGIKCRPDGPVREHRITTKRVIDLMGNSFHLQSIECMPGTMLRTAPVLLHFLFQQPVVKHTIVLIDEDIEA